MARESDSIDPQRQLIGFLLLSTLMLAGCVALCALCGVGASHMLVKWFGWNAMSFSQAAAVGAVGGSIVWIPGAMVMTARLQESSAEFRSSSDDLIAWLIMIGGSLSLPLVGVIGASILGLSVADATVVFSTIPAFLVGSVIVAVVLVCMILAINNWMGKGGLHTDCSELASMSYQYISNTSYQPSQQRYQAKNEFNVKTDVSLQLISQNKPERLSNASISKS